MRRALILGLALAAAGQAGCSDEGPTEVGSGLIGEGFRTYEVVLDASAFLRGDTTYDRIGDLNRVQFAFVAEQYAGELSAHTLFRVSTPASLSYQDPDGGSVTDTEYTIIGGTLTAVLDSLADHAGPAEIEMVEVVESWDRFTASWEERVDTAEVAEPWAVPGGTPGRVLGSRRWAGAAGDTLRIALDSAAAAIFADSAAAQRGALLRSATPGTRLRFTNLELQLDLIPASVDTVLQGGSLGAPLVVAAPDASMPESTELRVGGAPSWRSAFHFQPLSEIRIPCDADATDCTLPLADVEVNLAALVLAPVAVDARRVERPLRIESRAVLRAPGVPVTRAPLTAPLGIMRDTLRAVNFTPTPPDPNLARVPVTGFVQRALNPPDDDEAVLWLALTVENEPLLPVFGYAAFGSTESMVPPRLQLVVTVPAGEASR